MAACGLKRESAAIVSTIQAVRWLWEFSGLNVDPLPIVFLMGRLSLVKQSVANECIRQVVAGC
jgi:hypothetical protein